MRIRGESVEFNITRDYRRIDVERIEDGKRGACFSDFAVAECCGLY